MSREDLLPFFFEVPEEVLADDSKMFDWLSETAEGHALVAHGIATAAVEVTGGGDDGAAVVALNVMLTDSEDRTYILPLSLTAECAVNLSVGVLKALTIIDPDTGRLAVCDDPNCENCR